MSGKPPRRHGLARRAGPFTRAMLPLGAGVVLTLVALWYLGFLT